MKYAPWSPNGFVSLIMLMGGGSKLAGSQMALQSFADLGLPGWFPTFIGICEVAGAIGIWLRRTSMLAAMGIAIIMIGAVYYHVTFPPVAAAAPAGIVLLICVWIASRRGTGVVG